MNGNQPDIFDLMWAKKVPFFLVFFVVTTISYAILVVIDFIPEPVSEDTEAVPTEQVIVTNNEIDAIEEAPAEPLPEVEPVVAHPEPVRIFIDKIGTDVEIFNPDTIDIDALDEVLLSGVARHPQSADFANEGNMLIFGHSSYLPNVLNPNFQAFNGVQDLTWGDEIFVESADTEYKYRVEKVYLAKASETVIDTESGNPRLTIVTCNSFATTDDRYIVEASLVSSIPLEA